MNFRRNNGGIIRPKRIFFETFWANSSGWFEGSETFFTTKKSLFHLYLSSFSLSSSLFFFILSLLLSCFFSLLVFSFLFSSLLFHLLLSFLVSPLPSSRFFSFLVSSSLFLSCLVSLSLSLSVSVCLCLSLSLFRSLSVSVSVWCCVLWCCVVCVVVVVVLLLVVVCVCVCCGTLKKTWKKRKTTDATERGDRRANETRIQDHAQSPGEASFMASQSVSDLSTSLPWHHVCFSSVSDVHLVSSAKRPMTVERECDHNIVVRAIIFDARRRCV